MHLSCLMGPPKPVQPEQDESHAVQTASEVSSKVPGKLQNELKGQLPRDKAHVKLATETRKVTQECKGQRPTFQPGNRSSKDYSEHHSIGTYQQDSCRSPTDWGLSKWHIVHCTLHQEGSVNPGMSNPNIQRTRPCDARQARTRAMAPAIMCNPQHRGYKPTCAD